MSITYKFDFDDAYCETLIEHYYRQLPWLLHLRVQFSILMGVFAVAWLVFRGKEASWIEVLAVVASAVAGVLGCVFVVKRGILAKLKSKRDFGLETIITISDLGLIASGGSFKNKHDWSAYPRAVRFADGILLRRPGVIRWLPDKALQNSCLPEQATKLVSSKTSLRHLG
jgi:hypothetical protein